MTAALANGKVDGYYTSPLAAASLRWYNRTSHIMAHPIAMGIGAVVVTKPAFDALTPEEQKALRDVAGLWASRLTKKVRKDNRKTLTLMAGARYESPMIDEAGNLTVGAAKAGSTKPTVTTWGPEDRREWNKVFAKVWHDLAGKVYSHDLLDRVRKLVK